MGARHTDNPPWQNAMGLAEHAYRLAVRLTAPESRPLADQIVRLAVAIPSRLAASTPDIRTPDDCAEPLRELETALLLAARLDFLSDADVGPALALIRDLLSSNPKALQGSETRAHGDTGTRRGGGTGNLPPPGVPASPRPPLAASGPPGVPASPRPRVPASSDSPPPAPTDRLLIDGSNFLGRVPGYALGDDGSRHRLLFRLQEYARRHPAHRVTVFFDGQHTAVENQGGVEVRFTSGRRPADDVILDFLAALPPADLPRSTVITDDRDLATRAKGRGVTAQGTVWLAERLERKEQSGPARPESVGKRQMDEWVEFFSQPPQRPGKKRT